MVKGERTFPFCAPVEEPMVRRLVSRETVPMTERVEAGVEVAMPNLVFVVSTVRKLAESRVLLVE